MLYLALQMLGFLITASIAGILIGWWIAKLNPPEVSDPILNDEDIYAMKHRLDKCFDDNTALRSQIKSQQDHIEKLQTEQTIATHKIETPDHLQEKIDVLMSDLQMRDDTIIALERELKQVRLDQQSQA